jgi:hypothetical protein
MTCFSMNQRQKINISLFYACGIALNLMYHLAPSWIISAPGYVSAIWAIIMILLPIGLLYEYLNII